MKMNWYFTQSHFPIFTCKLRYLTNGVVSIVSSCGTWATANMHGTKKRWISMSCIIAIDVLFWSCNFQCLSNEVFIVSQQMKILNFFSVQEGKKCIHPKFNCWKLHCGICQYKPYDYAYLTFPPACNLSSFI